jgi:hypothetical protein
MVSILAGNEADLLAHCKTMFVGMAQLSKERTDSVAAAIAAATRDVRV